MSDQLNVEGEEWLREAALRVLGAVWETEGGVGASRLVAAAALPWLEEAVRETLGSADDDEDVLVELVGLLCSICGHAECEAASVAWLCDERGTRELLLRKVDSPYTAISMECLRLLVVSSSLGGEQAQRAVVDAGLAHDNSRYFGETFVRLLNQTEIDPLPPPGYESTLSFAAASFGDSSTAEFLYPADQKLMIEVLLRHMESIPLDMEPEWQAWLRTVRGIVLNTADYASHMHKSEQILTTLSELADEWPAGQLRDAVEGVLLHCTSVLSP